MLRVKLVAFLKIIKNPFKINISESTNKIRIFITTALVHSSNNAFKKLICDKYYGDDERHSYQGGFDRSLKIIQ